MSINMKQLDEEFGYRQSVMAEMANVSTSMMSQAKRNVRCLSANTEFVFALNLAIKQNTNGAAEILADAKRHVLEFQDQLRKRFPGD